MIITRSQTVRILAFSLLMFLPAFGHICAQTLPYEIVNNSEYTDENVYVAIVGITGGHVWVDPTTGQVNPMSVSDNTVPGPVIGGDLGPGNNGLYANCFRKLSDIPNRRVNIPKIAGCRILISFESPLYLYFFGHSGSPSGYAAPNLDNPTDPNQGVKFEMVELTYNDLGLWCNTSRVDAYQYPMGLEVWGNNFYKKVGELKTHNEILSEWQATAPAEFQGLLDSSQGMIRFPTKTPTFPSNFFQSYIDAIWSKYRAQQLVFNSGQAGVWRGSVQGDQFIFTRDGDRQRAVIPGKPNTLEAMEGSGVLASGGQWDKVVQAQFVAAITRHAIDLDVPSGVLQDFGNTANYYQQWPYNWYAKFLHQPSISVDGLTYAFAYDDVFDQSATIHTPGPVNVKITLGGFAGSSPPPPASQTIEAENFTLQSGGMQTEPCSEGGLNVGYIETGDWMVFSNVTFPETGSYTIEYRVASAINGARLSADLEAGTMVLGEVSIPNTGGWQNWTTVQHTVFVNAGTYNLGIFAQSGGWNINWLRIGKTNSTSGGRRSATVHQQADLVNSRAFPNPFPQEVNISFDLDTALPVSLEVIDIHGSKVHTLLEDQWLEAGNHIFPWQGNNLPQGLYFYRLTYGNVIETFKIVKK